MSFDHYILHTFLPLLRRFNPAEPVVEKSVILERIKISRAFPHMLLNRSAKGKFMLNNGRKKFSKGESIFIHLFFCYFSLKQYMYFIYA